MKIGICGDWHGDTAFGVNIIQHAKDQGCQAILHCGDFGYKYTDDFQNRLAYTNMPIFFVAGNHDDYHLLETTALRSNLHYMQRGSVLNLGGCTIVFCGGAHSVDKEHRVAGFSYWPEELITVTDVERIVSRNYGTVDIMITHDAPSCVPNHILIENAFGKSEPITQRNRDLLQRIYEHVKPKTLYHGHWHQRYSYLGGIEGLADNYSNSFTENMVIVEI